MSAPLVDEKVVRQLHELAEMPFAVRAFRDRWQRFGWTYNPQTDDHYGFGVLIDDERTMMVDPLGVPGRQPH